MLQITLYYNYDIIIIIPDIIIIIDKLFKLFY